MAQRPLAHQHRWWRHERGVRARLQPHSRRRAPDSRYVDVASRERIGLVGDERRRRSHVRHHLHEGRGMTSGWILPDLSEPTTAPFWEGAARGELLVQACGECAKWRVPPRPLCPYCPSPKGTGGAATRGGGGWACGGAHPPLLSAVCPFAPCKPHIVVV